MSETEEATLEGGVKGLFDEFMKTGENPDEVNHEGDPITPAEEEVEEVGAAGENEVDAENETVEDGATEEELPTEEEPEEDPFGFQDEDEGEGEDDESPKSPDAKAFARQREQIRDLKKQLAEVDPEASKGLREENDKLRAEVTALKDQRETFVDAHYEATVRETDEYRRQVIAPQEQIQAKVESISRETGISIERLANALREEDFATQARLIDEMVEKDKLPRRLAGRLESLSDNVTQVNETHRALLADAKKNWEAEQGKKTVARQEEEAARKDAVEAGLQEWSEKLEASLPLFVAENKDDLADRVAASGVAEMNPRNEAYMRWAGAVTPKLIKLIKTLDPNLAKKKGGGLNLGEGNSPSSKKDSAKDEPMSLIEAAAAFRAGA